MTVTRYILIAALFVSIGACDPGIYLLPTQAERIDSDQWKLWIDSLEVEAPSLGGLISQTLLASRFRIRNHGDSAVTITDIFLQTQTGTYYAGTAERGFDLPLVFGHVLIPPGRERKFYALWRFPGDSAIYQIFSCPCSVFITTDQSGNRRIMQIPYSVSREKIPSER